MAMEWMSQTCGFLACLFIGVIGLIVIFRMVSGDIDLSYLISEPTGQASMARFQLLIFTFVVAISLFKLVEKNNVFPDIPGGVLTILGISASTYGVGKAIQFSRDEGVRPTAEGVTKTVELKSEEKMP
jgi:uncharacterized BrkB/YihY/UPF0761 family membrane protein